MTYQLYNKWISIWNRVGVSAPEDMFDNLILRYSDPSRSYHGLRHLSECLRALELFPETSIAVEFALWFHNIIFDVKLYDNEWRSAEFAFSLFQNVGVNPEICESIRDTIRVTSHNIEPASIDQCVIIDCDIAIFGSKWKRFLEYEKQIRKEYDHIPDNMFKHIRIDIFNKFLDRQSIYYTPILFDALEEKARQNLQRAIKTLENSYDG